MTEGTTMHALKTWLSDLVRGSRVRSRERAFRTEQLDTLLARMQELAADNARLERELDELRADSRRIAELRILVEQELGKR